MDPLAAGTGGAQQRGQIFNALNGGAGTQARQAGVAASRAATAAGSNPAWGEMQNMAQQTGRGQFLAGSPQLNNAINSNRAAAMASSADQNARIQGNFNRNGMAFSTGNQEAQEANTAAASAGANRDANNTFLQNYMSERSMQNAAPGTLATAESAPLSYLNSASTAGLAPLQAESGMTQQLAGGTPATPSTAVYQTPGMYSQVLNGLSLGLSGAGGVGL